MPLADPEKRRAYDFEYKHRPEVMARAKARVRDYGYRTSPEGKAKQREYANRPDVRIRHKAYYQKYWLKKNYGLTKADIEAMLIKQGNVCAICGHAEWGAKGPHVDHDHKTGAVRGLLCHRCNVSIGLLDDDPARARTLADYLEAKQ